MSCAQAGGLSIASSAQHSGARRLRAACALVAAVALAGCAARGATERSRDAATRPAFERSMRFVLANPRTTGVFHVTISTQANALFARIDSGALSVTPPQTVDSIRIRVFLARSGAAGGNSWAHALVPPRGLPFAGVSSRSAEKESTYLLHEPLSFTFPLVCDWDARALWLMLEAELSSRTWAYADGARAPLADFGACSDDR